MIEDAEFLKRCALWAERDIPYHFQYEPTREEIRLLTAIRFIVWGDKDGMKEHHSKYSKAFDWAIFDHAYKEIFTIYSWCPNALIPQPPQPIFHKLGHITRALDYEPHMIDQLLPVICPILILGFLFLASAAIYFPWLAPICSIAIIIIFTAWRKHNKQELKWKAQKTIAITLWGHEIKSLMKSPAFLSWACYKYQTDKLNPAQKKQLREFICSHHLWATEPPTPQTSPGNSLDIPATP
ncbi:MAG: hypothetical protein IJN29_01660 [Akkermansia sp.]|nr:hypothetical protein [Akkermansia sp.]